MDQQQIDFFVDRFSGMDDEELSVLVFTRRGQLSDEAQFALDQVVAQRDPSAVEREMKATSLDLGAQQQDLARRTNARHQYARSIRNGVRAVCGLLVVAGVIAMYFDFGTGLVVAGAGILLFVFNELRALVVRYVLSFFDMK